MVSAWGWEVVSWATGVIGRENILFEEWECKDRCGSSEDKDGTVVDSIKPGHANETVRDHHQVAFMNIWAEQRLQWALYYYFCQVFQRVWDEILVPRNKMPPTGKKQKTCSSQSSLTWSHISTGVVYASPGSWICLLDDISENSESTNYVFDIFLIPVVKGFSLFSSTLVTSSLFHWVSPLGLHATPPFLQSSKMVWGYGQLGLFCQDSRDQRPRTWNRSKSSLSFKLSSTLDLYSPKDFSLAPSNTVNQLAVPPLPSRRRSTSQFNTARQFIIGPLQVDVL